VLALVLALPALVAVHTVTVEIDSTPGSCGVRGQFHVAVAPPAAWDVVADYDHIPDFVHSMVSSHTERQPDGRLRVRQTAIGGVFLFRRRVHLLLEIDEQPGRRIGFRDVLGRDFERYSGEWTLDADSTGTRVRYALDAHPKAAIPRGLCRSMLRRTARQLLEQVRDEMLRRAGESDEAGESTPQPTRKD